MLPLLSLLMVTASIASENDNKNIIKYIAYKNSDPTVDIIDARRWGAESGFTDGGRQDFMLKFFYANTRAKSNSGIPRAACFEGTASAIAKTFFNSQNKIRGLEDKSLIIKTSTDEMMMGIKFRMSLPNDSKVKDYFFRLPHCLAGKSAIDELTPIEVGSINKTKIDYQDSDYDQFMISEGPSYSQNLKRNIAQAASGPKNSDGFLVLDDPKLNPGLSLPKFKLKADYDKYNGKDVLPWKNADVSTPEGALKLSFILQKYIYENMANQDLKNPDMNFDAYKNTKRYFCNTPWLNVGPAGREGIHGMTKERDLKPSETMDVYAKATSGSDWGVSYYNGPGCKTINAVYGAGSSPKSKPNFNAATFEDGSFSAKMLFTTADFPEIKGAYTWNANVSGPGSNYREVTKVRHIQMDIAVKDKSIKGSNPALNNWIMYTYYYDPDFDYDKEFKASLGENPLKSIAGIPKGLLKMRPMGIQTGFGNPSTKESVIFAGAQTNGVDGRLNGPADNSKGSCLGCHGTSGIPGKGMVPGFLSNQEYRPVAGHLDFSQQFALGKRNFETAITDK